MTSSRSMAMGLYASIVQDASKLWPELQKQLSKEFDVVHSYTMSRGFQHILSELPAHGKHLDKCLSEGRLRPPSRSHRTLGQYVAREFPFGSLLSKVFDLDCDIDVAASVPMKADPCPNAVFFLRTLLYCFKKVEYPCPEKNTRAAVADWLDNDRDLREASLFWEASNLFAFSESSQLISHLSFSDALCPSDSSEFHRAAQMLDHVCKVLSSMFPVLEATDIIPRHGPGAVADMNPKGDKYILPHWERKLEVFFPQDYFAYHNEWSAHVSQPKAGDEVPGRLIAVPKTYDSPRLITVEPTSHQFLQQGLLRWLRANAPLPLKYSVDFFDQGLSRSMAREASLGNGFSTVDLKSASDRLSLWTVERVFRVPSLLEALHATRTRFVSDGTDSGLFDSIELKKFAGQGSAVTFPIQSFTYAVFAACAVLQQKGLEPSWRNIKRAMKRVRVFGDDIILPTVALPYLAVILQLNELKINMSKTHYEGHFRESCGGDYFMGYDVTPLYFRDIHSGKVHPSLFVSRVDVANNAFSKGLWTTASKLDSLLREQKYGNMLPISDTPQGGPTLRTYCSGPVKGVQVRNNKYLHRPEYRGVTLLPKVKRLKREGDADLFSFFIENVYRREVHLDQPPWSAGYSASGRLLLKAAWVLVA